MQRLYLRKSKIVKGGASLIHTFGYAKVAEGKLDAYLHEEENSSDDAEQDLQGEIDIMSYLIHFSLMLFLIQHTSVHGM